MEKEDLIRIEEYYLLGKRVNSFLQGYKQNLALIGPPFSGKTYLVEYFLKNTQPTSKFLPLYIDLEYLNSVDFIYQVLSSLLLYFTKQKKGIPSFLNLDSLILENQEIIPQTIEKIKNTLNLLHSKEKPAWDWIAQILDKFIEETQQKIVFIMENFTSVKHFSKKILSDLAKYIALQKNIMFIFIAKRKREAEEILSQELNLIFGNFEKIYLKNFSYTQAYTYLESKLGKKIEPSFKKFLIDITDGFPFYLEIVAQELAKSPKENIEFEDFVEKLSLLFSNRYSCVYQIFTEKVNFLRQNFKDTFLINPLLILIASGYTRKKELFSLLRIDNKNLNSKLSKLLELDILDKNGSFYFIPDKLFSLWISSVFKLKRELPLIFSEDTKKAIKNKLKEKFEETNQAQKKDSFQRFLELLQLFKDDTIKTGKKLISLPQIKRLRIIPAHNKNMKFIIGEAKRYYLILAFKEDIPEETDILEFSNRCSYFRYKQPKKIFITLKKADITTKVLAKEKRLNFWEKEDVNLLLRLYNKPLII